MGWRSVAWHGVACAWHGVGNTTAPKLKPNQLTEVEEHDVALRLSVEESLGRLEDAKRKGGGSVLWEEGAMG